MMLPFFLHGAYFLEMLAVFQLNGILLCVVVTFLSSLMWEEEAIDYMRWGFTLTHTHTHEGRSGIGFVAPTAGSSEKICVWQSQQFWGLSPQEPLCLIQGEQVHRETKRLEKGGKVREDSSFFSLSTQHSFLFLTSKATGGYLNSHHDSHSGNFEKGLSFLSRTLCGH